MSVLGKTRSGKSTALHQLLSVALVETFQQVIILDGKSTELHHYSDYGDYASGDEIGRWAELLENYATDLMRRYRELVASGVRVAAADAPRCLIVIDEVQRGTRHKSHGSTIKRSLDLIAEQSGALNDIIIIATQRETNAIPPSTRYNMNIRLTMLGNGYFHLHRDGYDTQSGRIPYNTPEQALESISTGDKISLNIDDLHEQLGAQVVEIGSANVELILGAAGAGKTHALENTSAKAKRHILLDCAASSHRELLISTLLQCSAVVPSSATIDELRQLAQLALHAEPTHIKIDNIHAGSTKVMTTLRYLIDVAAAATLTANTPTTGAQSLKLESLRTLSTERELSPLPRAAAKALANAHIDADVTVLRQNAINRIVREANGHPSTIVDLARRTHRGTLAEMRTYHTNRTRVSAWPLLLLPVLFLLVYLRSDGYMIMAVTTLAIMMIRPLLMRSMSK